MRSALSVDLEHPDVERIRKEFELFRLNKENEAANAKKKEAKLETENRKLRVELQVSSFASLDVDSRRTSVISV